MLPAAARGPGRVLEREGAPVVPTVRDVGAARDRGGPGVRPPASGRRGHDLAGRAVAAPPEAPTKRCRRRWIPTALRRFRRQSVIVRSASPSRRRGPGRQGPRCRSVPPPGASMRPATTSARPAASGSARSAVTMRRRRRAASSLPDPDRAFATMAARGSSTSRVSPARGSRSMGIRPSRRAPSMSHSRRSGARPKRMATPCGTMVSAASIGGRAQVAAASGRASISSAERSPRRSAGRRDLRGDGFAARRPGSRKVPPARPGGSERRLGRPRPARAPWMRRPARAGREGSAVRRPIDRSSDRTRRGPRRTPTAKGVVRTAPRIQAMPFRAAGTTGGGVAPTPRARAACPGGRTGDGVEQGGRGGRGAVRDEGRPRP